MVYMLLCSPNTNQKYLHLPLVDTQHKIMHAHAHDLNHCVTIPAHLQHMHGCDKRGGRGSTSTSTAPNNYGIKTTSMHWWYMVYSG